MHRSGVKPQVVFTGLDIFNRPVPVDGDILSQRLPYVDELCLSYRESVFRIYFSAMSYWQPSDISYSYYLEGFDTEWIEIGNHQSATYTNLPPGTYILHVRAVTNEGTASEEATLRIVKVFWALDADLAYQRHFPAINWLTSYSLYLDDMEPWFNKNVESDWMETRQNLMSLLQEEASLNEIVKMVGMDALSPKDRLKMEAARSIREDFLHQNSFDEIDTYTSLKKQYYMMKLVYAYYEEGARALDQGADINALVKLPAREQIGRYKYTPEKEIDGAYQKITEELSRQMADLVGKEDE